MASEVSAPSHLSKRRRRDKKDMPPPVLTVETEKRNGSIDFSLSTGEDPTSNPKKKDSNNAPLPTQTLESRDQSSITSKSSGGNHSHAGKKPCRKRKGSVDFALAAATDPAVDQNKTVDTNPKAPSKEVETREHSSVASKGSGTTNSQSAKRTFRKRNCSVDFTLSVDDTSTLKSSTNGNDSMMLPSIDALPSMDSLPPLAPGSPTIRGSAPVAANQLNALGEQAGAAKKPGSKSRKESVSANSKGSDNSSSFGTFASQTHRFLLEAFMGGDSNGSLVENKTVRTESNDYTRRERLGSFDNRERISNFDPRERTGNEGRERLESWGGMSDLSLPVHESSAAESLVGGGTATAAAIAAKLVKDLTAAANLDGNESISSFLVSDDKIPSKISLGRDRLNSIASAASETSLAISNENEVPSDLQNFVQKAMANVGDQLAELANAAEKAGTGSPGDQDSELGSTMSPIIGATSDAGSKTGSLTGRPRSGSASYAGVNICVDYDAVAAAVDAAQAAAGAIDLAAFAYVATPPGSVCSVSKKRRRQLPTHKSKSEGDAESTSDLTDSKTAPLHKSIPKSTVDDRDMEIIREKARRAAGYIPPASGSDRLQMPSSKKLKVEGSVPKTPNARSSDLHQTPHSGNSSVRTPGTPYTPISTPGSVKSPASKGQSSQKWDSMFDCLLQFINDRRDDETKDMQEDEKEKWIWDGNVPTTFKTKDGKALGRWVNNQRSAKSKGVLKEDREKRLVNAGLKWSVLASNSWNEMLEELRIYVSEQTKAGRKWDGNVPTNYRIKTKAPASSGNKDDEDKNLGRWVNRQRSLYQAGKLRKDRQQALEKVGLKWSMLATTSWESMYDTLCEYVDSKTKDGAEWDGNVPANYRTNDNPPRALGRWINRQRSAYGKDKLKKEYIAKLNKIGLKWSVHERRPASSSNPEPSTTNSSSIAAASTNGNKIKTEQGKEETSTKNDSMAKSIATVKTEQLKGPTSASVLELVKSSTPGPITPPSKIDTAVKVELAMSAATAGSAALAEPANEATSATQVQQTKTKAPSVDSTTSTTPAKI